MKAESNSETKSWLKYFLSSEKELFLNFEAIKVYEHEWERINQDEKIIDNQNKYKRLQKELEDIFDKSDDDFVKVIIGIAFVKGFYFSYTGCLSEAGYEKKDIYKGTNGKRFKEFSDKSVDCALRLCNELLSNDSQYRLSRDLIGVAMACSIDRQSEKKIAHEIEKWANSIFLDENNEKLSVLRFEFLIPNINYLLDSKIYKDKEKLLSKIDSLLDFAVAQGDSAKTERSNYNEMGFDCIFPLAFDMKIRYARKMNDKSLEKDIILSFAQIYEKLGEDRAKNNDAPNLQVVVRHYEEAVNLYRINGFTEQLLSSKRRLDELKKQLANMPDKNRFERVYKVPLFEDDKKFQEYMTEFNNQDISTRIIKLLSMTPFITREQITLRRKQAKKINPFSEVFRTYSENAHHQEIFVDADDKTRESNALYTYIMFQMAGEIPFLESITKEIQEIGGIDFLTFITEKDSILLKRKDFFVRAFEFFFMGERYIALHLLVPQIEYWFRETVYSKGGQTSNLKSFPVEQAKTFTPILESDELKEFLGEDTHWLFEQLMNKEPMNLRNKIAHGLDLNDNGFCEYFVLCVMKLLLEKQGVFNDKEN